MAKPRHNQNTPEPASRGPLVMLTIGALLVAGLVVWALTRTVETPATPLPSIAETTMPALDTSTFPSASTPAIDTSGLTPPIPSATAGITTSSQAPVIQGDKAEVVRISAEDLREKMKAGTVTIVDVRDASAYAAGHIPGALHIPMPSVESNIDLLPKEKEIVTYCA